jgi:hypothetical protein
LNGYQHLRWTGILLRLFFQLADQDLDSFH